jgi:hypothetical protein
MSPTKPGGNESEYARSKPGDGPAKPNASLAESAVFKASQRGANRLLSNYRNVLASSFNRMSRFEQESLVQRVCLVLTLGVTGLALLLFYPVIPRLARVFGVPIAGFAAWWAGNRLVTAVVLGRIEHLLNKE